MNRNSCKSGSVDLKKTICRTLNSHYFLKKFKSIISVPRLSRSQLERSVLSDESLTVLHGDNSESKSKTLEESENKTDDKTDEIWIKKVVDNKRIYIHSKTGMSSFETPVQTASVRFSSRNPVLPKGFSPQNRYEIDCVPNIISDNYTNIFNGQYGNDSALLEYPSCFLDPRSAGTSSLVFNRENLLNMKVIGQMDKKFITALEWKENIAVVFDQHAVSERILLERLMETNRHGHYIKKHMLNRKLVVQLPQNVITNLCKYDNFFDKVGFKCEYSFEAVSFESVPRFLYKYRNTHEVMYDVLIRLIEEFKQDLSNRRRISLPYPRVFLKIMASQACRGAVKFGDSLSKSDCQHLLDNLCRCRLPFQCAHGRPAVFPLYSFHDEAHREFLKPNFQNLFKRVQFIC